MPEGVTYGKKIVTLQSANEYKIFQPKRDYIKMAQQDDGFKKIVSHAKEYGFVFQSSEIYDGLAAVYDYGQNGVEMKNNKIGRAHV